jgi:hypothetical protein
MFCWVGFSQNFNHKFLLFLVINFLLKPNNILILYSSSWSWSQFKRYRLANRNIVILINDLNENQRVILFIIMKSEAFLVRQKRKTALNYGEIISVISFFIPCISF